MVEIFSSNLNLTKLKIDCTESCSFWEYIPEQIKALTKIQSILKAVLNKNETLLEAYIQFDEDVVTLLSATNRKKQTTAINFTKKLNQRNFNTFLVRCK